MGGYYDAPPPNLPLGAKNFEIFFHQKFDQVKKIVFAFYSKFCLWTVSEIQPPIVRRHETDTRKSLQKTRNANISGTAGKILILKKVLRNNPTFRNFLWKNIGGLLWRPTTQPPPRGEKFWNFFSPNFRSHQKNSFAFYSKIVSSMVPELCSTTTNWQDYDNRKSLQKLVRPITFEWLYKFWFRQKF